MFIRSAILLGALLSPATALAQQSCQEIEAVVLQCPNLDGIAGDPPTCFCDGNLVENPELSCAVNFGCATGDEVGFGTWPDCSCRPLEEIVPPGGGGGGEGGTGAGVGGGLGGVATCEQFFGCPDAFEMNVQSGQCVCAPVMLPQIEE